LRPIVRSFDPGYGITADKAMRRHEDQAIEAGKA
jgi:hypothetical protein